MPQILNAVLIGLVAFFAFLAVFGLLTHRGAGAEATPATGGAVNITAMEVRWQGGGALVATVHLRNAGTQPAMVESATYSVEMGAASASQGELASETKIAAGGTANLRIEARLDTDAPARWLADYAGAHEHSGLHVRGEVRVRAADGLHTVPFDWASQWTGSFADGVAGATHDCDALLADEVCTEGATATWATDGLHLVLLLRNDGTSDATIHFTSARLELGGTTVAAAADGAPLAVPAAGTGSLEVGLAFDGNGIRAWWGGHAARCEDSTAELSLRVVVQTSDGQEVTRTWHFQEPDFSSHLACVS